MVKYSFPRSCAGLVAVAVVLLSGASLAQVATSSVIREDSASASAADFARPGARNGESAQNSQVVPMAPTPQSQRDRAAKELRQQEHQRILGVIPNFNTTDIQDAAPLSPKQKFQLAFRSSIDPFEFFAAGALAGYGQATDDQAGYGQGAQGYGKRFGAAYADSVDGALWGNAIFPVLLHQDARYFRRGTGSFWSRFKYAVSTTVWTKNDNGTWGPNYSNVLGNIVAGGISNLYYPSDDRGVGLTFEGAATVTAEGALGSLGVEFWPDISRKLFHKRDRHPPTPAPK